MTEPCKLTVAVAQIESAVGDIDTNVERHLAAIDEARTKGIDVLMFPELSLTGHSAGPETLRLARTRDDEIVTRLAKASGAMTTIFGLIEEAAAAQFYNTAMVVKDGHLHFHHRKINIQTVGLLDEGKHFATGRYLETFGLGGQWRASVPICADVWNPALVWLAALQGATILFTPVSSAVEAVGAEFDNPSGWETNLKFYAMTYGFPVVMANRVGKEGDLTFWGRSRILDPFGREIARAGDGEELITAEIDYEVVRNARFLLPTVRDSNFALVLRETERLVNALGVPTGVRKV